MLDIRPTDNTEKLMAKITTIKQSLNSMNGSFEDAYSRKVYKNLKQQLVQLQIQLIEGEPDEKTKDDGSK